MTITYETNAQGESIKVTTNGLTVIKELDNPAPTVKPFLSKVMIMRRITPTEWALFNASTDPMAVYAFAVFNATGDVDPSDPLTVQLFGALESMGILAAGRAAQILA